MSRIATLRCTTAIVRVRPGLPRMITPYTMGELIHILQETALIVVIVRAIQGQRQMTDARLSLRCPSGDRRAIRESNTV
jgi:ABC-type amino acid transport system permease subunit